jgi:hypothetical protein
VEVCQLLYIVVTYSVLLPHTSLLLLVIRALILCAAMSRLYKQPVHGEAGQSRLHIRLDGLTQPSKPRLFLVTPRYRQLVYPYTIYINHGALIFRSYTGISHSIPTHVLGEGE